MKVIERVITVLCSAPPPNPPPGEHANTVQQTQKKVEGVKI